MVTLSIELVGDPSNGNLWSVLGTVTPAPTMVNEYYVSFYVNNIFFRKERGAPYAMFGDDGVNPTLSRLTTDGTYQIRVEAWDTTQTILHDTKTMTVIQTPIPSMVTLSIELVGDPSNGNLWSVLGTVTPAPTMVNEYYVKFYINDTFYRTERGAPYAMFGDDGVNPTLSRLNTDGTYQIRVEAWDTTQTILHDTKTVTVIQTSTIIFTRTIKVVQGNGTVNVYKNGTFVGTATPTSQYVLTAELGESYSVTGIPATGYIFEKVCTNIIGVPCKTDITSGGIFTTASIISHTKEYYFVESCQTPVCGFIITSGDYN